MTEILKDVPIEEIRDLRRRISERFDHDPARLVAYYIKLQEQYRDRSMVRERPTGRTSPPHDAVSSS